uniref:F-box associated beta-propeller type 3 domain-containing protein n=1 Tax=Brassica oleracea TaxID=3712 RepID=A0A3P6BWN8_BRAOL|nr:unnamed protein product [Brassica oleracea]
MIRGEDYVSIPTDLIPEILLRLPGKSMARFIRVSKLWLFILTRPRLLFVLEQVNGELIFFSSPHPQKNPYEKSSPVVAADFLMKFSQDMLPEFRGLSSGLIYFSNMRLSKKGWKRVRMIYNLNTRQYVNLPKLMRYRKSNSFLGLDPLDRPPVVAPRGRSRLRERPGGVAARRRSGSLFASYLVVSLRSRHSQLERPYGVAAERRCKVALVPPSDENASDIGVSLWPSHSEGVSQRLHGVALVRSFPCTARPMINFITSFELQMHPNVSKNSMWYSNT